MKNILQKKQWIILIVSLLLVTVISVGATIAYVYTTTGSVTNTFTPTPVGSAVVEKDQDPVEGDLVYLGSSTAVKENVQIRNTGDATAYIRATVVVTWKNAAGQVYARTPVAGTDYNIEYAVDGWWKYGEFYYHTAKVEPENNTGVLITSCKLAENAVAPEGYHLSVEILASAIQATPESVAADQWGVTIENGVITGVKEARAE